MKILAKAKIEGPEAIGDAKIVTHDNGTHELQLSNFWVAPGAPDVRIVFSKDPKGNLQEKSIRFIAMMPDGNFNKSFLIDHLDDFDEMKTLIVYCKQFFAHFGHGTLQRL
ncbi:DM13 domain-containing protein [Aquimarina sediminis]|uniref:DM13 domain-containing protein n=1 Tax=Aquimarina sediminis TaxID=2070536 RepID=UPI000CA0242C|nr:DM13 domain-containing protein [Aquimarina sediminis]